MPAGFRICIAAAALCGSAVLVQAAPTAAEQANAIRQQIETALASIQYARCGGEVRCAPASAAETDNPPLSLADATSALDRGTLSGLAKVCGLDWIHESFQPMVEYWRSQGKSDRQIALIGILHGMSLARTEATIGSRLCTDKLRRDVQARLPTLP